MKKLVLVLALVCVAPAFALNVFLTDNGDGSFDVDYSDANSDNLPRGFALDVAVDSGAIITDVNDFKVGESTSADPGFGIFPGSIDLTDVNNPVYNTPVAPATDPGADSTGVGTSAVVLELGSLYVGDGNAPATSGTLCTVYVDCNGASDANITMAAEVTYRGGVVLEDGTAATVAAVSLPLTCSSPECMKDTAAGYTNWVNAGMPDCWCYEFQPLGDIDGQEEGTGFATKRIGGVDLGLFAPVYGKKRAALTGTEICCDLDHLDEGSGFATKAVGGVDLARLAANYGKKTSALDSSSYAADYNFWVTP